MSNNLGVANLSNVSMTNDGFDSFLNKQQLKGWIAQYIALGNAEVFYSICSDHDYELNTIADTMWNNANGVVVYNPFFLMKNFDESLKQLGYSKEQFNTSESVNVRSR